MSDDSFFREVDEELRQDKVKAVWTRFGTWLLVGAVSVVVVTAGFVAFEHYQTTQANAAGDRYAAAVKLADDGKTDEAIKALKAIANDDFGAYPALARLSIGGIEAKAGRSKEAVAAYDSVSNDDEAPKGLRDMAAIRAAYVLVDTGTLADVRQRVERLSGDSDPLRFPAREAIALAAWKAGDAKTAKPLLDQLVTDQGTPRDISGRARILLDLINSGATGPNALPPAKDDGKSAAPAASADNGLGVVDLPGLLDGSGGASDAATGQGNVSPGLGDGAMPTTDLGASTAGSAPDASGAAAPNAEGAGTSPSAPADASGTAAPSEAGATAPTTSAPAGAAPADAPPSTPAAPDAVPAAKPAAEAPSSAGETPVSPAPAVLPSGGTASSAPEGTNPAADAPAKTAEPAAGDASNQPADPAASGSPTTPKPTGN